MSSEVETPLTLVSAAREGKVRGPSTALGMTEVVAPRLEKLPRVGVDDDDDAAVRALALDLDLFFG
jgi:hypothetical protein